MPLFISEQHLLLTQLSPEECRVRLEQRLARWFSLIPSDRKPIEGWVSNHQFEIRKFVLYRNPYQLVARGTFAPSTEGTYIVIRFALSQWVKIFIIMWLGLITSFAIFSILQVITTWPNLLTMPGWLDTPAPPLLILILGSIGVIWLGQRLSRNEPALLMRFLRETLEAEERSREYWPNSLPHGPAGIRLGFVSTRRLLFVVILGLLAGLGLSVFVFGTNWLRYYQLANYGISVEGLVVSKYPDSHQAIEYRYSVGEQTHRGVGNAGYGTRPFEEIAVGDQVLVVYLPMDSEVSSLGDPRERLKNETMSIILSSLIFSPFFVALGWPLLRRAGRI